MKWGEIYRTEEKIPERGNKPGFYVVVSRDFVAANDDIETVVCAPIYSQVLGLRTEVIIGTGEGVSRESSIRCDSLTLIFKSKLASFVGILPKQKQTELQRALTIALQIGS